MLKTIDLSDSRSLSLTYPSYINEIDINSPLGMVFTDFKISKPLVIDSNVQIDDAVELMRTAHVRLKLVINDKLVIGLVTYSDLIGEKPITLEARERIPRSDINVSDIMTRVCDLTVISDCSLEKYTIRDLIVLLKEENKNHVLVFDKMNRSICGLVSTSEIIKKLKLPISSESSSHTTFSKIFSKKFKL